MTSDAKYRILVADDEEVIREACLRILTRAGYGAEAVSDGVEALARAREGGYDLLLLDIKMPGLDGIGVMKALDLNGDSPRVVVITGHGTAQTEIEARQAGASVFLTKPFTPNQLREAVAEALPPRE